jgi:DNA polymerase V
MSGRVMRILADFTPELELYSIDEAFLGLGGFETRLEAHGRALRQRVLQGPVFRYRSASPRRRRSPR